MYQNPVAAIHYTKEQIRISNEMGYKCGMTMTVGYFSSRLFKINDKRAVYISIESGYK